MRRRAWPLFLLLMACGPSFTEPDHWIRFEPPARYQELYLEAAECSGLEADFERLEWYSVPGTGPFEWRGELVYGLYSDETIAIAEDALGNEDVVVHELLHAMLDPIQGHPDPPYRACVFYWGPG